jgi:acetyl esterase
VIFGCNQTVGARALPPYGSGWEAGDKSTYIRPRFATLTEAGIGWFSINYRPAPQWKHPAAVEDIQSAYAWIRANAQRLGIDPKQIAIMGESAGGHLAMLAGLRSKAKPAALITFGRARSPTLVRTAR